MSREELRELFSGLDARTKGLLADEDSPLALVQITLHLAETEAKLDYLSLDEIHEALEAADVAVDRRSLARAIPRAGQRLSRRQIGGKTRYSLMTRGRRQVESRFESGAVELMFVEGTHPRTTRKSVADLLGELEGLVRICDPYYGIRSLELLEVIPGGSKVQFLTGRTNESASKLSGPLADFKKERPNVELRVARDPRQLHDRYILAADRLLIIGHGLKDLGGKESFVISLPIALAANLMQETAAAFDGRWTPATPL